MKTQLFVGDEPKPELLIPPTNGTLTMPLGGLWTATWLANERSSDWAKWCIQEKFRPIKPEQFWLLEPDKSARIYEVDSLSDLIELQSLYSLQLGNYYDTLDFEAMSRDWDGLHLTLAGQQRTRHTMPNLYGWDVESTCWFRWKFSEVKKYER